MNKILGWVWSNVLVPLMTVLGIGTIASQALDAWLRRNGYIEHPESLIATVVAWLADQTKSWWLLPLGAILLLIPGISIGWKKYIAWRQKRDAELSSLGSDMTKMASSIRIAQAGFHSQWPENISNRRGALDAILVRASSYGLAHPDDSIFISAEGYNRIVAYLDFVGAHLKQGNTKVAKAKSRDLS
jgi:hypothetical protein